MGRGKLRVYLGAAPGVGKTFRMLEEGHRRLQRGTDVVVGYVEPHPRPNTTALLEGLEIVPPREISYRGTTFRELDVAAVLHRKPDVALVDEMAHTNAPGSHHEKRWQDINTLLNAGIDVITTVNVQHLASLNDVVEQITGVAQQETVPDAVVRRAEQVELVDMTAEALRRRMAHGNVYRPEKVDAALGNYFRVGNLTALRELALLWLADRVDAELDRYRRTHNIDRTWEARERVVVALTGGPEGDTLIRRAARIAERSRGADLHAVHIATTDGISGPDPAALTRQRDLVESIGGSYHHVAGDDIPRALLSFARGVNATQLVLGASRRGRLAQAFHRGIGMTTVAESGAIDVHLVTHDQARQRASWRHWRLGATAGRLLGGLAMTLIGLPLLAWLLIWGGRDLSLSSNILIFLAAVVVISLVGRLLVAFLAALLSSLLLNYFFTPPRYTLTIAETQNLLALVVFLLVAITVSATVDFALRRAQLAAEASREATTLATVASSVLRGSEPVHALLEQLRESYSMQSVSLLSSSPENGWEIVDSVGEQPCASPHEGDGEVAVGDGLLLVLKGRPLQAVDRRVVEAFAAQAALAWQQQQLAEQASTAASLSEVDKLRTALLRTVSHDLRTPLASAKAAVHGMRANDVIFDEADRQELLATADESLDRLTGLVENLLDMSRLQAGALGVYAEPVSMTEVVSMAVDQLGDAAVGIGIESDEGVPDVDADPGLLERILVNLLSNAVKYSPADAPPTISVSAHYDMVQVRVVDRGVGVPPQARDHLFEPFQRMSDTHGQPGIGLGLALSLGLAESMLGTLEAEDTPGGGLTMILSLPRAIEPPGLEPDFEGKDPSGD